MEKVTILFLFLSFYSLNPQFLIPSTKYPNKYDSIQFPETEVRDRGFSGERFVYSPPKSTKIGFFTYDILIDYCNTYLNRLKKLEEWKNQTFCQKMFCEDENPLYKQALDDFRFKNFTTLTSSRELYYSAHYICSKCVSGMNQTYYKGTFQNCKWSNLTLITNLTIDYSGTSCPSLWRKVHPWKF